MDGTEQDRRIEDEPYEEPGTAVPSSGEKKSPLPGGKICGNVFHETMEALCNNDEGEDRKGPVGFLTADVADKEEELLGLIREKMRRNSVRTDGDGGDAAAKAFLRMVRHALNIELAFGDCGLRPCGICPGATSTAADDSDVGQPTTQGGLGHS